MFGYVKPFVPMLRVGEYAYYKAVYCGLCRSMKRHTGGISTLTLQYDFVFLALLLEALNEKEAASKIRHRRCAAHPLKKRPMLEDNASLSYCACASALLTYYRAEDERNDAKRAKRAMVTMTMPLLRKMRSRAGDDFAETEEIVRRELNRLNGLERDNCPYADEAADCFGALLRAVFAAGCKTENHRRIAGEIGYHVGKWIYLADAADDYPADSKSGNYNPLLTGLHGENEPSDETKHALADAMRLECRAAVRALELAELNQNDPNSSILYNILYLGMPRRAEEIIANPGKHRKADRHGEILVSDNLTETNHDEKSGEENE